MERGGARGPAARPGAFAPIAPAVAAQLGRCRLGLSGRHGGVRGDPLERQPRTRQTPAMAVPPRAWMQSDYPAD
jgi:hypothetical protein